MRRNAPRSVARGVSRSGNEWDAATASMYCGASVFPSWGSAPKRGAKVPVKRDPPGEGDAAAVST